MFETLAPPLLVMWLVDWLDFEVAQGGLAAYLGNSHGRYADHAIVALRDIGATRMADALKRAARLHIDSQRVLADVRVDPLGEYEVDQPYAGWPHIDEVDSLTDEFQTSGSRGGGSRCHAM